MNDNLRDRAKKWMAENGVDRVFIGDISMPIDTKIWTIQEYTLYCGTYLVDAMQGANWDKSWYE